MSDEKLSPPTSQEVQRLVREVLGTSGSKAARAERSLFSAVEAFGLATGLEAIAVLQEEITRRPGSIDAALGRSSMSLLRGISHSMPSEVDLPGQLDTDPGYIQRLGNRITANAPKFARKFPLLSTNPSYKRFLTGFTGETDDQATALSPSRGASEAEIAILGAAWGKWANRLDDQLKGSQFKTHDAPPAQSDEFVDLVFAEPRNPKHPRFIDRRVSEIRFADIKNMAFPLSQEDWQRITDLAISLISRPVADPHHILATPLFFKAKPFLIEDQPVGYRHAQLFANLNNWQERLVDNLVYPKDAETEKKVRAIFQAAKTGSEIYLLGRNLGRYMLLPFEIDFPRDDEFRVSGVHPFSRRIANYITSSDPIITTFWSFTEMAQRRCVEEFIPRLIARTRQIGVSETFAPIIEATSKYFTTIQSLRGFEQLIVNRLITRFNDTDRQRLDSEKTRVDEGIEAVRKGMLLTGISSLPLEGHLTTIIPKAGGLADRMGVEKIRMTTVSNEGDPSNWHILVRLDLKGIENNWLRAKMSPDGTVELMSLVEEQLPGISSLFKLITIAAIRDLTTKGVAPRKSSGEAAKEPARESEQVETPQSGHILKTVNRGALNESVIKEETIRKRAWHVAGKRQPTFVAPHPMSLPLTEEYRAVLADYYLAQTPQATEFVEPEDSKRWAKIENVLEKAREAAHKASADKIEKATFQLHWVTHPISASEPERHYLQTWVKQHRVPKLEATAQSFPVIFNRVYRQGSAMQYTDEFISLLVGLED